MHNVRLISHRLFVEATAPAFAVPGEPGPGPLSAEWVAGSEAPPVTVLAEPEPPARPLAPVRDAALEMALT